MCVCVCVCVCGTCSPRNVPGCRYSNKANSQTKRLQGREWRAERGGGRVKVEGDEATREKHSEEE